MIVVPQIAFSSKLVSEGEELPPIAAVRELARLGAKEIQLLDLDGGIADMPLPQWLEAIVAVAGIPLRFDGRLHDARDTERLTKPRFSTIVIDHTTLFDPMQVRWALDLHGSKLCVELQVDGEYLFDAPQQAHSLLVEEILSALHMQGVRRILYRSISESAAQSVLRLRTLIDRVPGMKYTYYGGVKSLADIALLAKLGLGVEAVVIDAKDVASGVIDISKANSIES